MALTARLERIARSEKLALGLVLTTFVLSLPSLASGPFMDDHWVELAVSQKDNPWRSLDVDAETMARARDVGGAGWWGSPNLSAKFFRPLACALHWFEFRHWPNAKWAMHLVNLVIYAALVALATLTYRRLKVDPRVAGIAAIMFALDDGHAMSAGWISGRNTLLVTMFVMAAVLEYIKARQAPEPSWSFTSVLCFALGLSAGESGICALAYLGAYALLLDQAKLMSRIRSLVPHALVAIGWALVYVSSRAGTHGLTLYRELKSPLALLEQGLLDLPAWLLSLLGPSVVSVSVLVPPAPVRLACLVLVVPFALWLWPTLKRDPVARFFALGTLLCLPPMFTTMPQDRLLAIASFGSFGCIACMLGNTRESFLGSVRWGRPAYAAMHLGLAPLLFIPSLSSSALLQPGIRSVIEQLGDKSGEDVVVINTPSEWLHPAVLCTLRNTRQPLPATFHPLYAGSGTPEVTRVDARTLEMTVPEGWGGMPLESMAGARVPQLPKAGDVVDLERLRVRVLADAENGMPQRVRFEFPTDLEDPKRIWYYWRGKEFLRWTPPAAGQHITFEPVTALSFAM